MQHLPCLTGHVTHTSILATLFTSQGGIQYVFYLKFLFFFCRRKHTYTKKEKIENLIPLLSIEIHKISLSFYWIYLLTSVVNFASQIRPTVRCYWNGDSVLIISIWFIVKYMYWSLLRLLWGLFSIYFGIKRKKEFFCYFLASFSIVATFIESTNYISIKLSSTIHYTTHLGAILLIFSNDRFSDIRPASSNLLSFDCLMCSYIDST